jgi:putative zinc finger/helix-turn-helix YgiT family protein
MTEIRLCPQCETLEQCEIVNKTETVTIKGMDVSFDAVLTRCTVCGCEFEDAGQLDANLTSAREAWESLYACPTPAQICNLRKHYDASQKAFGFILGFGELTINSYEKGSVPDSTNRLLLKLAGNPAIFKAMYEINKDKLGAVQRRRIEASAGYREALAWQGAEGLWSELAVKQQEMLSHIVNGTGKNVVGQANGYIELGILRDYSAMVQKNGWTPGETTCTTDVSTHDIEKWGSSDVA